MTAEPRQSDIARRASVTVLLCDVARANPFDTDWGGNSSRNGRLEQFVAVAHDLLTQVGGTMADLPGDTHGTSIMAVFGAGPKPGNHALEAVNAGVELRQQFDRLAGSNGGGEEVNLRTGVNSGTVLLTTAPTGHIGVAGAPIESLVSLQRFTKRGQILLGPGTYELVRGMVSAEPLPLPPDESTGHSPAAWLLQTLVRNVASGTPMVGRDSALDRLELLYQEVVTGGASRFVTVSGDAGVGKSRLVQEFVRSHQQEATVLFSPSAPYGRHLDNLAYWPIAQIMRQAADIRDQDPPDMALARLRRLVDDPGVIAQLSGLLDLPSDWDASDGRLQPRGTGEPDDLYRAVSQALERMAGIHPLILVFDDLQWAHPALLRLIKHLTRSLVDSKILFTCLARPILRDLAPWWTQHIPDAVSIPLDPLSTDQIQELIGRLLRRGRLTDEVRARLTQATNAARGYPLFVEAMIASFEDEGRLSLDDGQWIVTDVVPERTDPDLDDDILQDLLAQLTPTQREVIQRAAVVGPYYFTVKELDALSRKSGPVKSSVLEEVLAELTRKQLVEPVSTSPGDETIAFQFRHLLIQETAYRLISEPDRALLHEQYANWRQRRPMQEEVNPDPEHVIGYHYDQAYVYWSEQGAGARAAALARNAARHLHTAGRGYIRQGDFVAAAAVLNRAAELLSTTDLDRPLVLLAHADALRESEPWQVNKTFDEALAVYQEAYEQARSLGNRRIEQLAWLSRLEIDLFQGKQSHDEAALEAIDHALLVLGQEDDRLGLAKSWNLRAWILAGIGRSTDAAGAAEIAIRHVRAASDARLEARILRNQLVILFWGPMPLTEVVEHTQRTLAWAKDKGMSSLEAGAYNMLARAAAMRGDFTDAHGYNADAKRILQDPGELLAVATDAISEGFVELYAGNLERAEEILDRHFKAQDDRGGASVDVALLLARVLVYRRKFREAEERIKVCRVVAPGPLHDTQIKWRELEARILAELGELDEAEQLAQEAVARSQRSEHFDSRGEALVGLAALMRWRRRYDEARLSLRQAVDLYRRKGDLCSVTRVLRILEELDETVALSGQVDLGHHPRRLVKTLSQFLRRRSATRDDDRPAGSSSRERISTGRALGQSEIDALAELGTHPGVISEYVRAVNEPMTEAEASARTRRLKVELSRWERLADEA